MSRSRRSLPRRAVLVVGALVLVAVATGATAAALRPTATSSPVALAGPSPVDAGRAAVGFGSPSRRGSTGPAGEAEDALPSGGAPPHQGAQRRLRRPAAEEHGHQARAPRARRCSSQRRGARGDPSGKGEPGQNEDGPAYSGCAGAGARQQLRGTRLRQPGAQGHPPDTNGDVGPNYYIQTINIVDRDLQQVERRPRRGLHVQLLHEPGQLREPVRHRQLRRPGRPLRQLRGPLGHHRLRLQARRQRQRQPADASSSASPSRRPAIPVDGGWNFYSIQTPGGLADYPKFGVWPDGIYMSANMFGYARGRLATSASTSGRSTRRRCTPDAPSRAGRRLRRRTPSDFTLIPATRGCRPARRRRARPSTSSRPGSS